MGRECGCGHRRSFRKNAVALNVSHKCRYELRTYSSIKQYTFLSSFRSIEKMSRVQRVPIYPFAGPFPLVSPVINMSHS